MQQELHTTQAAATWALTAPAHRAGQGGRLSPGVTADDVMALIMAMRGLVQATGEPSADTWPRFLDLHLAGLRAATPPERSGKRSY
ncbi:MAG: hypothetical protein ACRDPO_04770 [Streptosporangiaceae bacterium]